MPDRQTIQEHPSLRAFSSILQDRNIFHLTRRSAAGGVSAGLFIAFLPMPGHTVLAMLVALVLRVNLPLCVLFTLVNNPLTIAPLYYLSYRLGTMLLGKPMQAIEFEMSWTWFGGRFMEIWPSVLTGCLILSIITSLASYLLIRLLWRLAVINKWKSRHLRNPDLKGS